MKSSFLALLLGVCLGFAPLSATTIVPFAHLGEATQYSDAVVLAVATYEQENRAGGMTFRDMHFQVKSDVKGPLQAGQEFSLRPESSFNEICSIDIAGDFGPEMGKTYLLWLTFYHDAWHVQMLSYYVFEEMQVAGQALLVPLSGSGIETAQRPDGVRPAPLAIYDRDELLQSLAGYHSGNTGGWTAPASRSLPAGLLEERDIPAYCDFMLGTSTTLCRWQNPALNVYFNQTNAPSDFSSTLDGILSTMRASYTAILPVNAGATTFTSDCVGGTATSGTSNFVSFCNTSLTGASSALIIFDDPCNEIPDLAACSGVLARGGSFSFFSTHFFKNDTWRDAGYGFVIVNNGVLACYQGGYSQLLTHELTHTYRLDHISTTSPGAPGQNMNPNCCNAINTLDVDCMNYSYDIALPVELTHFSATKKGEHQALISWNTATEKGPSLFTLEHSADGVDFSVLTQVSTQGKSGGGHYEWLDNEVFSGINYYRLLQSEPDGRVTNLGLRTVQFGSGISIKVFPSPLAHGQRGMLEIVCSKGPEIEVDIVRSDGQLMFRENLLPAAEAQHIDLPASLPPGVYRAVMHAGAEVVSVGFSKE
jgi:hypothetical protein